MPPHVDFTPYPTQQISPEAPRDYQTIPTRPQEFGVQIGAGLEKLGQGMLKASDVYSDLAAQQATTSFLSESNKVLHGDPEAPAGSPENLGYFGLHGQAAMDARAGAAQRIERLVDQYSGQLTTNRSQMLFENESRRYQYFTQAQIGEHYDREAQQWGVTVNHDKFTNSVADAALNPGDEGAGTRALASATDALVKGAQLRGDLPADMSKATPEQLDVAKTLQRQASVAVLESRMRGLIGRQQFSAADALMKQNEGVLSESAHYDTFAQLLHRHASASLGDTMLREAEGGGAGIAPQASIPGGVTVPRQSVVDFWKGKGASGPAAEGIADRVGAESGFSSGALGDGGTSLGLYQHHAERASSLMKRTDWQKPDAQNEHAWSEVTGGDPVATAHWDEIKNAPTRQAAAQLWDKYFERSKSGPGAARALVAGGALPAVSGQVIPLAGGGSVPAPSHMPQMQDLANAEIELTRNYAQTIDRLAVDSRAADNPEAYEHALRQAETQFRSRQLALTASRAALTEQRSAAMDQWTQAMMQPAVDPSLMQRIADDPRLDGETRQNLTRFYDAHVRSKADSELAKYGPEFYQGVQGIATGAIRDPTQLLKMTMPDEQGHQALTVTGYQELEKMLSSATKTPEGLGDAKLIDGALARAKHILSFAEDTPYYKVKDPKGMDNFSVGFMHAFYAHLKSGLDKHTIAELTTEKEIDPIIAQFKRSPAEEMRDNHNANLEAGGPGKKEDFPDFSPGDVWLLRQHDEPEYRAYFDQTYGAGSADKVLGPLPKPPPPQAPIAGTRPEERGAAPGAPAAQPRAATVGEPHLLPQYDELGHIRPLGPGEYVQNLNGSWSNELTVTVTNPDFNGGKPSVIPTLWVVNGTPTRVDEKQATSYAVLSGLTFPRFKTVREAEEFASDREKKLQTVKAGDADMSPPLWKRSVEEQR